MTRYKGYYIDNAIFHSKKEIDEFIKNELIARIKKYNHLMMNAPECHISAGYVHGCMEQITAAERKLHEEYGMSYEELELLELEY